MFILENTNIIQSYSVNTNRTQKSPGTLITKINKTIIIKNQSD